MVNCSTATNLNALNYTTLAFMAGNQYLLARVFNLVSSDHFLLRPPEAQLSYSDESQPINHQIADCS